MKDVFDRLTEAFGMNDKVEEAELAGLQPSAVARELIVDVVDQIVYQVFIDVVLCFHLKYEFISYCT